MLPTGIKPGDINSTLYQLSYTGPQTRYCSRGNGISQRSGGPAQSESLAKLNSITHVWSEEQGKPLRDRRLKNYYPPPPSSLFIQNDTAVFTDDRSAESMSEVQRGYRSPLYVSSTAAALQPGGLWEAPCLWPARSGDVHAVSQFIATRHRRWWVHP